MKLIFTVRLQWTNLIKCCVAELFIPGIKSPHPVTQNEQGRHCLRCRYAATLAAPPTRSEDQPLDWLQPAWQWATERHSPLYVVPTVTDCQRDKNQHLHAHRRTAGLFVCMQQWMLLRFLCPGGGSIERLALCVSGRERLTAGTLSNVWTVDSQCDDGASMCLVT